MKPTIRQRRALRRAMESPIMRDQITPAERAIPETIADAQRITIDRRRPVRDLGPVHIRVGHLRPAWSRLWQCLRAWRKA